jgi:hypothetical protein
MRYLNLFLAACLFPAVVQANVPEQTFTAFITGYSSETNQPPNSTVIWLDGNRGNAGGSGTYDDPITVAVAKGRFKYGTVFYVPHLKRYFKAEDLCPPCTSGHKGLPWLDVYVGNAGGPDVHKCKGKLTGVREVIQNPKATHEADLRRQMHDMSWRQRAPSL